MLVLKQMKGDKIFFCSLRFFLQDDFWMGKKQQGDTFIHSYARLSFEPWQQANFLNSVCTIIQLSTTFSAAQKTQGSETCSQLEM